MTDILIDASFLVALGYPHDRNHNKAKEFAAGSTARLLIPDVVLPEAIYSTFDRHDFSIIGPHHVNYFELLP
jgi:predicted nucleic acid-binding protein